jgi:hypothetical protein
LLHSTQYENSAIMRLRLVALKSLQLCMCTCRSQPLAIPSCPEYVSQQITVEGVLAIANVASYSRAFHLVRAPPVWATPL